MDRRHARRQRKPDVVSQRRRAQDPDSTTRPGRLPGSMSGVRCPTGPRRTLH
jgi:hypothetical protein